MSDDETLEATCGQCRRSGDIQFPIVNYGTHLVGLEQTDGGLIIQWQAWGGYWYCHTCLADYAAGDDAESYYPESIAAKNTENEQ